VVCVGAQRLVRLLVATLKCSLPPAPLNQAPNPSPRTPGPDSSELWPTPGWGPLAVPPQPCPTPPRLPCSELCTPLAPSLFHPVTNTRHKSHQGLKYITRSLGWVGGKQERDSRCFSLIISASTEI